MFIFNSDVNVYDSDVYTIGSIKPYNKLDERYFYRYLLRYGHIDLFNGLYERENKWTTLRIQCHIPKWVFYPKQVTTSGTREAFIGPCFEDLKYPENAHTFF